MAKPKKLPLTKAVKYYKAGYPEDSFSCLDYFKNHPSEAMALVEEVSAFVNANTLEEACKFAVKFDYGCDSDCDPNDWRSHVEGIALIREAAGWFEFDYTEEGIIKDLVTLVVRLNNEEEAINVDNPFDFLALDKRIELVYGRIWEGK